MPIGPRTEGTLAFDSTRGVALLWGGCTNAGSTWSDSGRGLPPGRAVAISESDPDLVVFAARNRLYVSRNGGRFWNALDVELPEIDALELREA